MNQEYIDKIKKARRLPWILEDRHEKELKQAYKKLETLRKRCNHKWPDGTSAVSGGMFYDECKICLEDNY
jgi:hypothetical protein